MKRFPRIEGINLIYYISSEAREGRSLFKDNHDRLYFLNLLRSEQLKRKLTFYAYILLPAQYAFIMETHKDNLTQSMHHVNSLYANYFNRRHNSRNGLFRGRYTCYIAERTPNLKEISLYLHLLPIKNGLAKSLVNYRWSSYPGYLVLHSLSQCSHLFSEEIH